MPQIIVTPNWTYKAFRNLIVGYIGGASEGEDPFANPNYIDRNIGTTPLGNLSYFKMGDRGGTPGADILDIPRSFYDLNIKNKNGGKGDIVRPLPLYAGGGGPIGGDAFKKPLIAENFTQYGDTSDSKVTGIYGVEPDESGDPGFGKYYNTGGITFEVGIRIEETEGNMDFLGTTISSPAAVYYNEIGLYDAEDVLCVYGVFANQPKNDRLVFKNILEVVLKTLDWRLHDIYT